MVGDADADAFPELGAPELAELERSGARRTVAVGEYLYREGDATYDFFADLSGRVDILLGDELIVSHGPGRFLGELNLLTGQRVYVSAGVAEAGEVIAVPRDELRRLLATSPRLSDTILASFLARRAVLLQGAASAIRVVGSRFSPGTGPLREFLVRSHIPHEWLDPEADTDVDALLASFGVTPAELPVVIVSGTVLRRPSPGTLAEYLGLTVGNLPDRCFDLVVVGGGPAGLAAAVYGASEGLRTLGLEMVAIGGQAGSLKRVAAAVGEGSYAVRSVHDYLAFGSRKD